MALNRIEENMLGQSVKDRFENVESQLAENANLTEEITKNPNNYKGAIVTFIDDDARVDFRTVWNPILQDTGAKITIAAITGWVGTTNYMTVDELKTLQNQGHEIVSHTVTHLPTSTLTVEQASTEYPNAQQWLKDNGFKGYDTLVYPGGMATNRVELKDVARKYYKYAVATNIGGQYNLSPVDNWRVPRVEGDVSTLDQLKSAVDQAILNNGWVILMTHSHVLLTEGSQKMRDFIAYVQGLNVPILPFGEATKYKGNTVAIGEFTEDTSTFIGANGSIKAGGSLIVRDTQKGIMDASITTYKKNTKTTQILDSTVDSYLNTGGVYEVFRGNSDLYSYATFTPWNSNKIYMRKWNNTTNVWNAFTDLTSPSIAYETGFWTPVLVGETVSGTHTYTEQLGSYTKIGNLVTARFSVKIVGAGFDDTMSGLLRITGLPFSSAASLRGKSRAVVEYNKLALGTNYNSIFMGIDSSANYIKLYKNGNGVATDFLNKTAITAGDTVVFQGEITYQIP